ncbi:MAG: HD-GYP domain-containing protein [Sporichthyaceae bacterium]
MGAKGLIAPRHPESGLTQAAQREMVARLLAELDAKDPYTRGHCQRVARLCELLALRLGYSPERRETLRRAALLHDIGKLAVPTQVLRKDGPLDAAENALILAHPQRGAGIVTAMGLDLAVGEAILHHHERVDGQGYPDALMGDQIPETSRIIAIADAFDAITSTRAYSPAESAAAGLAELTRCAASHFDARLVAEFAEVLADVADYRDPAWTVPRWPSESWAG